MCVVTSVERAVTPLTFSNILRGGGSGSEWWFFFLLKVSMGQWSQAKAAGEVNEITWPNYDQIGPSTSNRKWLEMDWEWRKGGNDICFSHQDQLPTLLPVLTGKHQGLITNGTIGEHHVGWSNVGSSLPPFHSSFILCSVNFFPLPINIYSFCKPSQIGLILAHPLTETLSPTCILRHSKEEKKLIGNELKGKQGKYLKI